MNKGDIDHLQSTYDSNSLYAERIAKLILVGLAIDIVAVFILGKSWFEAILTISADSLILIGVWGELFFERRAKAAGDSLVATANARAAEAQLELTRLRATRSDELKGKEAELIAKLAPFAGTQFDIGCGMGDGEQADFIWDLEPILANAGWKELSWCSTQLGPNLVIHRGSSQRPTLGNVSASNVEIHLSPNFRAALSPAANAVISALTGIGINARDAGYNIANGSDAAVHILTGPKR